MSVAGTPHPRDRDLWNDGTDSNRSGGGGSWRGGGGRGKGRDSAEKARHLTNMLLEGIDRGRRTYERPNLDIYIGDVEQGVDRFADLYQTYKRIGTGFPCVRTAKGVIPANWAEVLPRSGLLSRIRARLDHYGYLDLETIAPDTALKVFRYRLHSFLSTRFVARGVDEGGGYLPGLQVRVDTVTPGLRVHYSPAYFFDPTNVLGELTTPAFDFIQPGRYIFGAARPGERPRFDRRAEYEIPPRNKVPLRI